MVTTATKTEHRPLSHIAREIRKDWRNPYFGAVPYINAMCSLDQITDDFYADTAQDVVLRFLCNCATWKGEVARRVKTELKVILRGNGYPIK